MKTTVITKVYEVRKSGKGWRKTDAIYFSKEKALERAKIGNETTEWNYRVYEWETRDILVI